MYQLNFDIHNVKIKKKQLYFKFKVSKYMNSVDDFIRYLFWNCFLEILNKLTPNNPMHFCLIRRFIVLQTLSVFST